MPAAQRPAPAPTAAPIVPDRAPTALPALPALDGEGFMESGSAEEFIYENPEDGLWYVDYECNDYMYEWSFEGWGVKYWSHTPTLMEWLRQNEI